MAVLFPKNSNVSTDRRQFLKTGLFGAAGVALYSGEVERHWVDVTRHEFFLKDLPEGFEGLRAVQLSDIHMDEYTEPFFLREVIRKVNHLKPDVVFLTGDYVSIGPRSSKFAVRAGWHCAEILDGLECRQRYAILGNHDIAADAQEISEALSSHGIQMLNNHAVPLERNGARIWLAGLLDALNTFPHVDRAIPELTRHQPGEPVVLLCHEPDYADGLLKTHVGQSISLMLSGHSHGGQVHIPFAGRFTLPYMGRKYVRGWYRLEHMQLYVNRGIGTVGVPFRFNCPPEITEFTLRRP
ncbi:MAG: metallophosphoesterase [Terracidiphilus sp.]|nr:metallophosphoesterase [Terracidiphilus sp.]